jgi:hypothetical protein
LSQADRMSAVARILVSHPQWSDRMIASVSGVSSQTVGKIRENRAPEGAKSGSRIGRDGRVRPVDGSDRRRLAHEALSNDPSLSLRQVAKIAGISPETVRDVRDRIRRGEDPLPRGRHQRQADQTPSDERPQQTPRAARRLHPPTRDWDDAVERLRADPSLRMTETGRTLLLLLQAHSLKREEWENISENIPVHCSYSVALMAKECAKSWSEFARRVEKKSADLQ